MISEPICVAPTGDLCGEGVVWHEGHGAVYWTDINRFLIHRFDSKNQTVRSWFFEEPVTALALTDRDNVLAVSLGSREILWEPSSGRCLKELFRLECWPKVRLNDGRADPRGSFWVGSMRNNVGPDGRSIEEGGQDGVLYRIDPNGRVTEHRSGVGISNTIAWSPDRRHFYFADSLANTVWRFDYDAETGNISNETPFLQNFPRGLPDGSTVDTEGYLWNCRFNGACIVRVAPNGNIDRIIEMPVKNVTNCAFGGNERKTLYVTTAAGGQHSERLAGGLFALGTEMEGQMENRFRPLSEWSSF
jgi:sugar lactone lactonase YvrE